MDDKLIAKCAQYANSAYDDSFCTPTSTFINNLETDTQVHLAVIDDSVVISFRGTTNLSDWKTDFTVIRTKSKLFSELAQVHAGFLKAYESVRTDILNFLKDSNLLKVVLGSHSLGAACQTLCALDIKLTNPKIHVSSVSFGSPRVGNIEFCNQFNKEVDVSYRCVYERDPITYTPTFVRFRHVKGMTKYNKNGTCVHNEKYIFPCGCCISHHSMDSYCKVTQYICEKTAGVNSARV
tara:strand:+ start:3209 stop:3919 length:711 start_codon:yes stop_codon:yes gene_type:complete